MPDDAASSHSSGCDPKLRHACGRYGSTLDYLQRTVQSLRSHGIHDRELERQYRIAVQHGLCEAAAAGPVQIPA